MSMSGTSGSERLSGNYKKLGNIDPETSPTNQEGVVVPVVQGRAILGVTWLDGALDARAYEVTTTVGKKKETVGYNYYADLGALICMGTVTRLLTVYSSEEEIWSGDIETTEEGYTDIVTDIGSARFRFGTDTQTQDEYIFDAADHPAYVGQSTIEFRQMFLGRDTTNARSIRVEVERLPDVPTAIQAINGRANPAGALYEVLTDTTWGLGLDESMLDYDSFLSVGAQLLADGMGMSYIWNSDSGAQEVIGSILDSFSGSLVWSPSADQYILLQGYVAPDTDDLVTIYAADCATLPRTTITAYAATAGEIRLDYLDSDSMYTDAQLLKTSNASIVVNGRRSAVTHTRTEIDTETLALQIAQQLMVTATLPVAEGEFEAMFTTVEDLNEGDYFYLELWPGNGLTVCRCTKRKEGGAFSRDVTISYIVDINTWANTGSSGGSTYERGDVPEYLPVSHLYQALLETPRFIATDAVTALILLGRAHTLITAFGAYASLDSGTSYSAASFYNSDYTSFGLPVSLVSDPGTGATIELNVLNDDSQLFDGVDTTNQLYGSLLLFLGDEIISLADLDYGDTLSCADVLRGFGDTKPIAHAAGTTGLIVYAATVPQLDPTPSETTARLLKFPSQTLVAEQDLDDVTALSFQSANRRYAPLNLYAVAFDSESLVRPTHHYNFADYELATIYEQGDTITVTFTKQDWATRGFSEADFYDAADLTTIITITDDLGTTLSTVSGTGSSLSFTAPTTGTHIYAILKTRMNLPNSTTTIDSRYSISVGITLTEPVI